MSLVIIWDYDQCLRKVVQGDYKDTLLSILAPFFEKYASHYNIKQIKLKSFSNRVSDEYNAADAWRTLLQKDKTLSSEFALDSLPSDIQPFFKLPRKTPFRPNIDALTTVATLIQDKCKDTLNLKWHCDTSYAIKPPAQKGLNLCTMTMENARSHGKTILQQANEILKTSNVKTKEDIACSVFRSLQGRGKKKRGKKRILFIDDKIESLEAARKASETCYDSSHGTDYLRFHGTELGLTCSRRGNYYPQFHPGEDLLWRIMEETNAIVEASSLWQGAGSSHSFKNVANSST